jgi:hypothetical protein
MVRPERVELSTFSLGMKCSIHLSYGRTGAIIADFVGVYGAFEGSARNRRATDDFSATDLLFFSPFLMFMSPLDLFTQAMQ